MPWYRVEIPESDVADKSATALMEDLRHLLVQDWEIAHFCMPPTDVSVHHRAEGGHVYYFSPGASKFAPELLREFDATACATDPDLSHFEEIRI